MTTRSNALLFSAAFLGIAMRMMLAPKESRAIRDVDDVGAPCPWPATDQERRWVMTMKDYRTIVVGTDGSSLAEPTAGRAA